MDEVGKLQGIADEKHRRVVADEIPVSFARIELEREAANVPLGIRRAEFAGNGRESRDHVGLGAGLQGLRFGVLRDIAGDRQDTVGAPAFRVNGAFRNALAVLVRKLLYQLVILHKQRTPRTRRQRILVIGDGGAGGRGEFRGIGHVIVLPGGNQRDLRSEKFNIPIESSGNSYKAILSTRLPARGAHQSFPRTCLSSAFLP